MTDTHEFLAPSSAGLTVNCAAAPSMQAPFPDDDSPEAIEGRAAHWVLACMLDDTTPKLGELSPEGVACTQEMLEGAALAVEAIGPERKNLYVERKLKGVNLHPSKNGGTPDVYRFDSTATRVTLRLLDYKFGHGFVSEYENWQCINYASLILEAHEYKALANLDVEITIIQPRNYHPSGPVRTWRIAASDLVPYWDKLRAAYHRATAPDPTGTPPAMPGPWCGNHYCRARHACPALQRSAYFAAGQAQQAVPRELTPHELGVELRILHEAKAVLDARIDGLEEQALSVMAGGGNVSHYVVAYTQPRTRWKATDAEVVMMGEMMGFKLAKPPEPVTPVQAAKLGFDTKGLTETPKGTPKLERDTVLQLRRVFG